jgi:uncharacterized protein (DUF2062 family)
MLFRRFRNRIRNMLLIDATPHRIALAFAVGIFIGVSPLLGIHTVLGLIVAYLFRFSRLATLTGVFVTNPVSIVPIYSFCIWVGMVLLGVDMTDIVAELDWHHMNIATLGRELEMLLWPFVVGTLIVGTAGAFTGYFAVRAYVKLERWEREAGEAREDVRTGDEG